MALDLELGMYVDGAGREIARCQAYCFYRTKGYVMNNKCRIEPGPFQVHNILVRGPNVHVSVKHMFVLKLTVWQFCVYINVCS